MGVAVGQHDCGPFTRCRQLARADRAVQVGRQIDAMYMGFFGQSLPNNNVTDYLVRVVKPKLVSRFPLSRAMIFARPGLYSKISFSMPY